MLVDEASGALVRPISWTWNGIRFGRLDPRATYTLFVHATATDLFTKTAGLRAGRDVPIRLERGQSVAGQLRSTDSDDETRVVAVLHGVEMEADLGSDGRFEVRGLPADATVDLIASAVGPGGARREARGRARAGDAAVVLDLTPTPR